MQLGFVRAVWSGITKAYPRLFLFQVTIKNGLEGVRHFCHFISKVCPIEHAVTFRQTVHVAASS